MKPTPEQIEKLANEIRQFLIDKQIWMDTTIYFNGKAYSTDDGNGHYAYNNPNDLIVIENADPRKCIDYCGEFLTMSFEGPLCSCMNSYGEYSRKFEKEVYRGLYSIFKKHGFYFEMGDHWNLTCYVDFGQEDMEFICDEPTEPIIMEPEDRTFDEWKFLCKLFGLEKADRIVLKNYRIEAHGKWKNEPVKELPSTTE